MSLMSHVMSIVISSNERKNHLERLARILMTPNNRVYSERIVVKNSHTEVNSREAQEIPS